MNRLKQFVTRLRRPDTREVAVAQVSDKYSEYLEDYELANLVKKYSDYIRFPITMSREKSRQKPKPEDVFYYYKA